MRDNKQPEKFTGGYGKIRGKDNPKPFTKEGVNGGTFSKWTEPKIHKVLDELEDWMLAEVDVKDDAGKKIGSTDAGNVFYRDFLFKKRLFADWITYVQEKFSTASKRLEYIDAIQEHKLQKISFEGKGKENITKFILTNKYGWKERSEAKVDQTIAQINWQEEKTYANDAEK